MENYPPLDRKFIGFGAEGSVSTFQTKSDETIAMKTGNQMAILASVAAAQRLGENPYVVHISGFDPSTRSPFLNLPDKIGQRISSYLPTVESATLFMEYLEDWTLADGFDSRNLSASDTLLTDLAISAVEGIEYMHNRGTVHNDINPKNLLFHIFLKRTKYVDLGSACIWINPEEDHNIIKSSEYKILLPETGTNDFVNYHYDSTKRIYVGEDRGGKLHNLSLNNNLTQGDLDFCAPERYLDYRFGDPRSDIYSLAHTLFYIVTNGDYLAHRPSFLYESPVAFRRSMSNKRKASRYFGIDRFHNSSNLSFIKVLQQAGALRPDDRFQNASEFKQALYELPD